MSDRLSQIRARIGATRQLETVITAMRGVAVARAREAQNRLQGVRAFADALGEAIGAALALAPQEAAGGGAPRDGQVVLAFLAEQGFAGAFSERPLNAARAALARAGGKAALFLVGGRGASLAAEHGLSAAWTAPMIAHVEEAPALADKISAALYERLDRGRASRVTLIHAAPQASFPARTVERPLVPLDLARFPVRRSGVAPLIHLPPHDLIAGLAREYVFAELCEAVVLSFCAENEARAQAMIAAKTNVRKTLDELTLLASRLRQEEITEEIIELAAR